MTYLAIYFAIGIVFSSFAASEVGLIEGLISGFLWPLALIWLAVMLAFNLGL